jgi:hypothetical protein
MRIPGADKAIPINRDPLDPICDVGELGSERAKILTPFDGFSQNRDQNRAALREVINVSIPIALVPVLVHGGESGLDLPGLDGQGSVPAV